MTDPERISPAPFDAFHALPRYAELHCLTNFSFLKGASHAEELVIRATELGYAALAITDECSLAGVVRAHAEAKESGLKLLIGSSFVLDDGMELVLIALNRNGYGNLSELITLGRMRCEKGAYRLKRADFDGTPQSSGDIPEAAGTIDHLARMQDCIALWTPVRDATDAQLDADARWFASTFPDRARPEGEFDPLFVPQRAWIAIRHTHRMDDALVHKRLIALGRQMNLPCAATGHVHMHARSRKPLHDTLTAIRLGRSVAQCGDDLAPNAERHLRSRHRLSGLFSESLLEETLIIANQCKFSMIELGYEYPREIVPDGETQTSTLRRLTEEGLVTRFTPAIVATLADGKMIKVREQIEHELALIADLKYEAFFLTVHDIVRYARSVGILCQGRGSAANSAVCFCLGITEVNPALQETLFERFLTKERNEPPDIDVDFEHQRREEVIQYIYDKYGRHRTALAATVIAYRTRSAIRDVGRALGLDGERIDRLSASHAWWDGSKQARERLEENGFDPDSPVVQKLIELTATLRSFPRHLSQHVGGFVISADKLSRMVPIENAAMEKPRDWDEALGRRAIYSGSAAIASETGHGVRAFAGTTDSSAHVIRRNPDRLPNFQGSEDNAQKTDGRASSSFWREGQSSLVAGSPSSHEGKLRADNAQENGDSHESDEQGNSPFLRKRNIVGNSSLPLKRDSTGNSSLSRERDTTGNSSSSRERDITGNSSLSRERAITGNSSLSRERDITGNSSLPRMRDTTGISSLSREQDITRNSSFPRRREPRVVAGSPSNNEGDTLEATTRPDREASTLFPTFRSVIQWDKDDLEELGLLKVDVLALGMLSAIRRALDLIGERRGQVFRMLDIPPEDKATYDMICKADTVGVFQIESRAQMSMLPRLLPRCFYDLVVEVAIVRPGPIQGGMVHPYLKAREAQRNGKLPEYPQPGAQKALERTLGVPIFQEQVMQLMMLAADFSAGEADKLRRAMAAWKRKGGLGPFHDRIVEGMVFNKYERDYAERIFKQVEGFGEYGFPESHAASFAFLVYVSCWIKKHEPAAFLAAMLNSQPLGFYSSSQLIQDAKRNDIEVRPIDVTISRWDATLEEKESQATFEERVLRARAVDGAGPTIDREKRADANDRQSEKEQSDDRKFPGFPAGDPASGRADGSASSFQNDRQLKRLEPAVRLGFNSVKSFTVQAALRVAAARDDHPFTSVEDLGRRARLSTLELDALAAADALTALAGHRRQARWQAAAHRLENDLMRRTTIEEPHQPSLPLSTEGSEIVADYAATGFTLRRHPLALLRPRLKAMGLMSAKELHDLPNGRFVRTTGIVTVRQRPGTAKGTIFVTLEDETGVINVIVWNHVINTQRRALLSASLLTTFGVWQRQGEVRHVVANQFFDQSRLIGGLAVESRDFH